jgi:hypothetical protein
MPKVKPPRVLGWSTIALLTLRATRGNNVLAVMVDAEGFSVFALESDRPRAATATEQFAEVASGHAHAFVGQGKSLSDALAKAELYANEWTLNGAAAPPCDCGEIQP